MPGVIGPGRRHALEGEVLSQAPSRWYLTGFLVPFQARPEEKEDPAAGEQVVLPGAAPGTGDEEDGRRETSPASSYDNGMAGLGRGVGDGHEIVG